MCLDALQLGLIIKTINYSFNKPNHSGMQKFYLNDSTLKSKLLSVNQINGRRSLDYYEVY